MNNTWDDVENYRGTEGLWSAYPLIPEGGCTCRSDGQEGIWDTFLSEA